ncbi:UDP-glucose/GDP-mannose dehydrogenase family protein [Pseudomonas sp. RGM2987]|uniref:UDP-glucose dehydrogenase family protein n=1 Tax=Pseudomonas sp. RGM2987 TaxID=2930090 RepID=UPI001FD67505|nr:UDP-glucose/GDP-mannose dehydrogenase family protein [Pseudomonas sp. RGM2987]MCJ8205238.1 UDP-glucose/GDP-mannose dehydrogenase family protein [Pseudomonas sp. RGM2987]
MRVTVFGTGYVGLVTGACLADAGHEVMCVDIDKQKIEGLKRGIVPIYEPGLDALLEQNQLQGRLHFTTNPNEGVDFGELQMIAVGTPPNEDGSADLQHVLAVAQTIGQHMSSRKIIVNKSTVPVGTADKVTHTITETLKSRQVELEFAVCSNPEFLKEGSAIEDFSKAARIIVGTNCEEVRAVMRECYAPYSRNRDKLIFMDVRSAELTKYAANAMLATKISFMNEIAQMAERLGADIEQVRLGIGSDPRIGFQFIYPGCGYGGSCFPKDVQALARTAHEIGYEAELLNAVESVNNRQKNVLFDKLLHAFDSDLADKTIAVWGLSFKPNTDDMRAAPSRNLMEAIWAAGGKVRAFDPAAMDETSRIYGPRGDLKLVESREQALVGADALVICTEWKQFRTVDFKWLKRCLNFPVLVDGRNLFDPISAKEAGFMYYAIGRGDVQHQQGTPQ